MAYFNINLRKKIDLAETFESLLITDTDCEHLAEGTILGARYNNVIKGESMFKSKLGFRNCLDLILLNAGQKLRIKISLFCIMILRFISEEQTIAIFNQISHILQYVHNSPIDYGTEIVMLPQSDDIILPEDIHSITPIITQKQNKLLIHRK